MTRKEQLEKMQKDLADKQKAIKKELGIIHRKEAHEERARQREEEQAEAVMFMRYCKEKNINVGNEEITVYNFVRRMQEAEAKQAENTAEM